MKSYYDIDLTEDFWKADSYASELAERDREERELEADQHADFYSGNSPEYVAFLEGTEADFAKPWAPIDATTAGPIVPECNAEPIYFGMELSTTEMLARMNKRAKRSIKRTVRRAA
jgi:hypothetical protein